MLPSYPCLLRTALFVNRTYLCILVAFRRLIAVVPGSSFIVQISRCAGRTLSDCKRSGHAMLFLLSCLLCVNTCVRIGQKATRLDQAHGHLSCDRLVFSSRSCDPLTLLATTCRLVRCNIVRSQPRPEGQPQQALY